MIQTNFVYGEDRPRGVSRRYWDSFTTYSFRRLGFDKRPNQFSRVTFVERDMTRCKRRIA